MKISTRGRYALRLMLDLALADPEEYCSVKSIAARQQISEKYMEQIISQLVKAGFVRSVRGAQGGYRLAYAPEKYTAGQILRLTEGVLWETLAARFPDYDVCALCEKARRIPDGLLVSDMRGLRLTPQGFLVSNAVIAQLLL